MSYSAMITQSNFLPWRGYFASCRTVDYVIHYDSQQFTRRDWRNRNKIFSSKFGYEWLTLEVQNSGNYKEAIKNIKVYDQDSIKKIVQKLNSRYKKSDGLDFVIDSLHQCRDKLLLSEVNHFLTREICKYLEIKAEFLVDFSSNLGGDKNEKLINLCKSNQIVHYFSGPKALSYLDKEKFLGESINVNVFNYSRLKHSELNPEPSIAHLIITKPRTEVIELSTFL